MTATPWPLTRLLQLASPSLPVGSFAYSQGLEYAVEAGWVQDAASLKEWLDAQLTHSLARVDLPALHRLYEAARLGDEDTLERWTRRLVAMRETRELTDDDRDRGRALARLLVDLEVRAAEPWIRSGFVTFATVYAIAAVSWQIPLEAAMQSYAWGWLENQVLSGVKLVPLGQVAGQRLLIELGPAIPRACRQAVEADDDEVGGTLPIVALASSLHETQYTRLFRS